MPVLLMDIKGDLSGITQPGTTNARIEDRHSKISIPWQPISLSSELFSISDEPGVRMRATISEFPDLFYFQRILELNDAQEKMVSLIFKYCDDNGLPLLDIKDFRKTLQYISNEGKNGVKRNMV